MRPHACPGDVDDCGICSAERDRIENDDPRDDGYTQADLDWLADARAADDFYGRW